MMPPITRATMMAPAVNLARFTDGEACCVGMLNSPARVIALFEAPMDSREYHRHEKKRGDRREYQSADDGAAQRGILFRALSEPQCHGNHTDDHRQSGHQYRPDAGGAGVACGADRVQALPHALPRKRNDQYAV